MRADRALHRASTQTACEHAHFLAAETRVPGDRSATIDFCFGGGTVLEFAYAGAPLRALVPFHGKLAAPTLNVGSGNIAGRILVLHRSADPGAPTERVAGK